MGFTIDQHRGYTKGARYKKELAYIGSFKHGSACYVRFRDEDGNVLHWMTNYRSKVYRSLVKLSRPYAFTVDYIMSGDTQKDGEPRIQIRHVFIEN